MTSAMIAYATAATSLPPTATNRMSEAQLRLRYNFRLPSQHLAN